MLTLVCSVLTITLLAGSVGPGQSPAGSSSAAAAQPPATAGETSVGSSAAQPPAALEPEDLPVSLDRIQRAISRPPAIQLDLDRPIFRTEIIGRKPTIEDILGPDFARGRANYGGMTHQEFLNMVTPKDVQGYAAFTTGEALTVAATSFVLQWALQRAIQKFNDARTERQREAARQEVQEALKELERARARAGLPPR